MTETFFEFVFGDHSDKYHDRWSHPDVDPTVEPAPSISLCFRRSTNYCCSNPWMIWSETAYIRTQLLRNLGEAFITSRPRDTCLAFASYGRTLFCFSTRNTFTTPYHSPLPLSPRLEQKRLTLTFFLILVVMRGSLLFNGNRRTVLKFRQLAMQPKIKLILCCCIALTVILLLHQGTFFVEWTDSSTELMDQFAPPRLVFI